MVGYLSLYKSFFSLISEPSLLPYGICCEFPRKCAALVFTFMFAVPSFLCKLKNQSQKRSIDGGFPKKKSFVVFQCYSLAVVGYRVATFNDCVEAATELQQVGGCTFCRHFAPRWVKPQTYQQRSNSVWVTSSK